MTAPSEPGAVDVGRKRPAGEVDEPPPPGQTTLVSAALAIGILLMTLQLWLLTVALDLFLAGTSGQAWLIGLVSGLIFAGGLGVLWLLGRRPRVPRPSGDEAAFAEGSWGSPAGRRE